MNGGQDSDEDNISSHSTWMSVSTNSDDEETTIRHMLGEGANVHIADTDIVNRRRLMESVLNSSDGEIVFRNEEDGSFLNGLFGFDRIEDRNAGVIALTEAGVEQWIDLFNAWQEETTAEQEAIDNVLASKLNNQRARVVKKHDIGLLGGVIIDAAIDKAVQDLRQNNRPAHKMDYAGALIEETLQFIEAEGGFLNENLLIGRAVVSYIADLESKNKTLRYDDTESKESAVLRIIRNRAALYLSRDPE
jgi:hypothetical protein